MASPSFLYRWLNKSNDFVELVPFLSLHGFCEAISEMLLCNAFQKVIFFSTNLPRLHSRCSDDSEETSPVTPSD